MRDSLFLSETHVDFSLISVPVNILLMFYFAIIESYAYLIYICLVWFSFQIRH